VKYKDSNHNGIRDTYHNPITGTSAQEPLLAGFTLNLYPNTTCSGTALATAVSTSTADVNGFNYTFGRQAPGNYSINETAKAGWAQTGPTAGGTVTACLPITPTVGSATATTSDIGNTPLSNIGATFVGQTPSTTSQISCVTSDGSPGLPGSTFSGTYSAPNVVTGTYTCTIVVADP
jgi:hypothetical protein